MTSKEQVDLDNEQTYADLDGEEMRARIRELPEQCADAWALTRQMSLPFDTATIRQVAILGMGGSAIGGALLAALAADICAVPISIVGGYDLPAHVQRDALVIASSYSGRTEETLCALAQAETRGCPIVVVTAGKEWATHAAGKGWPVALFDYRASPRAALGYSFTLLLGILCRLGLLPDQSAALEEAIALLRERQEEWLPQRPTAQNPAKLLAQRLAGHLPVVYGAGFLAPVARRWKGQFNENSKNWAFWEELPELNHNAVVGYVSPAWMRQRCRVLFLRSPLDPPRIQLRWQVTGELLAQAKVPVEVVWGYGENRLAQMLSLIHYGDYVSLYLAMLNRANPTQVAPIDYLKKRLAEARETPC
jgi:glucose/mannose-6-phosphate isomerase